MANIPFLNNAYFAAKVGIGTDNPSDKLDVQNGYIRVGYTGGAQFKLVPHSSNDGYGFYDVVNTNYDMWFDGGNVGIGTTSPGSKLHVQGTSFFFDQAVFDDKVGIGTTSPSQKLHVAGNARVTGAYYDSNNSPGTANQVLVSTVTGTDWVDGSAIPSVPGGSGTVNTIPLWTPDGDTLGNSIITQPTSAEVRVAGKLKVSSTVTGYSSTKIQTGGFGDSQSGINILNSTTGYGYILFGDGSGADLYRGQITYKHGDDFMAFNTAGSQRMTINSSGSVGIGTTSPTSPLTIKSNSTSSSSSGLTIQSNGNTNNIFELAEKSGDSARLQMMDAGVTKIALYTDGTDNYINSGNVGIGTDSPGHKLEVYATGDSLSVGDNSNTQTYMRFANSRTMVGYGGANAVIQAGSGKGINFNVNNDSFNSGTAATITSSGNVGIGTTSPSGKLQVDGGKLVVDHVIGGITIDTVQEWNAYSGVSGNTKLDLKIGRGASNKVSIFQATYEGGGYSDIILQDQGGNVGIGTTSPGAKLEVNGVIRVEGGTYVASADTVTNAGIVITEDDYIYTKDGGNLRKLIGKGGDVISIGQSGTSLIDGISFLSGSTPLYKWYNNASEIMRLNATGLGIGTTSPSQKLHVDGSIKVNADGFFGAGGTGTTDGILSINGGSGTGGEAYLRLMRGGTSGFILNHTATAIQVRATANIPMFFYTNDTIGIKLNANSTVSFPEYAAGYLKTDASGNITADNTGGGLPGGPYLPLAGGTMSGNTNHSDNVKDRYGTGNDFQIWHDGSNTFLSNEGEGHLNIINTGDDRDIVFKTDDGSGATTSYMVIDGSAEQTRFYKDTRHTDNVVANFGNSDDLQIYHDGSNSYINQVGVGKLVLQSASGINIQATSGETRFTQSGVNSEIKIDDASQANKVVLKASGNSYFNGGNVGIGTTSPGNFTGLSFSDPILDVAGIVQSRTGNIALGGTSYRKAALMTSTGTDAPYLDLRVSGSGTSSNTTTRMRIDSAGNVGIGTTSPTHLLTLETASSPGLKIKDTTQGATLLAFSQDSNSHIGTYSSHPLVFDTNSAERMRITSSGNVGIGTTSPDTKLDIEDSNPFVTIQGSSSSYVNAGVQFISNQASTTRGLGNFYYSAHSDVEWFSGLPYGGNDAFVINRNASYTVPSSQSSPPGIGASAGTLLKVDSAGAIRFNNYSGTNKTGTATYLLGTDANGNVVKTNTVPGSSAGPYLPLAGGTMTGSAGVVFPDSFKLNLGTGSDLEILHDGADSIINNNLGHLYITQTADDKDIIFRSDNGSGGVTEYLFLDGSQTNVNFQKDAIFTDGIKALFGGSGDLQIYHDGSNSYVNEVGAGDLYLQTNGTNMFLRDNSSGNTFIAMNTGTADVVLKQGGATRLTTTSTGVSVTGAATATTFLGDLNGTINTATTAVTQANAVDNETVATTAYVNNKIGLIPAGLVFQGTWNAATNTPTLASGTGTTGNFYIVSVAGSTNLDGITDWKVGDWAVFIEQGASDQWEKIDNSSVLDGIGTGLTLPLWAGSGTSNTLDDSIITQSNTSASAIATISSTSDYQLRLHSTNTWSGIQFDDNGPAPSTIWHNATYGTFALGGGGSNVSGKKLHVHGAASIGSSYAASAAPSNGLIVEGNVGIGTISPSTKLEVAASATTSVDIAHFSNSNDVVKIKHALDGLGSGRVSIFDASNNEDVRLSAQSNSWFNAGNVGVGTTSPLGKLQVNEYTVASQGNQGVHGEVSVFADNGDESLFLGLKDSAYPNRGWAFNPVAYGINSSLQIKEHGSTAVRMTIQSGGNVGIGTTSPSYKLTVSGGGIQAGGKITYTKSAGSLDTTGYAVAGLTTSSNGQSAGFTFTCFGHTGGYQKIVYSCYNGGGTWVTKKVINEGTNQLDVVASANGTTITFTFKSISGTMSYTPRVTVEAVGTAINSTYA